MPNLPRDRQVISTNQRTLEKALSSGRTNFLIGGPKGRPSSDPEKRKLRLAEKCRGFYVPLTIKQAMMGVLKQRPLTIKEHAYVDNVIAGVTKTKAAMIAYGLKNKKTASTYSGKVEARPVIRSEIERRLKGQGISADSHLRNINDLAFNSERDEIRLRASQDLLDRSGVHYKYFADDGKITLETHITETEVAEILKGYEALPQIEENNSNKIISMENENETIITNGD